MEKHLFKKRCFQRSGGRYSFFLRKKGVPLRSALARAMPYPPCGGPHPTQAGPAPHPARGAGTARPLDPLRNAQAVIYTRCRRSEVQPPPRDQMSSKALGARPQTPPGEILPPGPSNRRRRRSRKRKRSGGQKESATKSPGGAKIDRRSMRRDFRNTL